MEMRRKGGTFLCSNDPFIVNYTYSFALAIVPCLNLDGFLENTRQNSNGVDLNRNLPTRLVWRLPK